MKKHNFKLNLYGKQRTQRIIKPTYICKGYIYYLYLLLQIGQRKITI